MILVIEGTDHAGKTSLADAVTDEYLHGPVLRGLDKEVIRLHRGPPDKRHILDQYEGDLLQFNTEDLTGLRHLFILDRWHLGEWLYGPLLRGTSRLSKPQLYHVELLLSALGATRCLIVADPNDLDRRHSVFPDKLVSAADAIGLQHQYQELCILTLAGFGWGVVDCSDGAQIPTNAILTKMIVASAAAAPLTGFSYVGSVRPQTLLVGDKPGGRPPEWARPFTPIRHGSASMFLESLAEPRQHLDAAGFANQDGTNLTELWVILGCPKVITLGNSAAAAASGIPYFCQTEVKHPQYVRRFHHDEWPVYVSQITELMHA